MYYTVGIDIVDRYLAYCNFRESRCFPFLWVAGGGFLRDDHQYLVCKNNRFGSGGPCRVEPLQGQT